MYLLMNMHIYVNTYVKMYVHIYVYMYVYMYICVFYTYVLVLAHLPKYE